MIYHVQLVGPIAIQIRADTYETDVRFAEFRTGDRVVALILREHIIQITEEEE